MWQKIMSTTFLKCGESVKYCKILFPFCLFFRASITLPSYRTSLRLPESLPFIMLHTSSSSTFLLRKIIRSTGQGGLTQWKSGSAAYCKLIGCPGTKQTGREPVTQGLEVGLYACWIVLPQCRRPYSVLTLLRRIQTDQQWLQINPFSDLLSDGIGPSASASPQWLFLHLRTKCTTLLVTCRGMLMCLILTPIWHCTGSL